MVINIIRCIRFDRLNLKQVRGQGIRNGISGIVDRVVCGKIYYQDTAAV